MTKHAKCKIVINNCIASIRNALIKIEDVTIECYGPEYVKEDTLVRKIYEAIYDYEEE